MGIFLGLLSSATFGLIPFFTLPLLHGGSRVETIILYRFGMAALFLWPILLARRELFLPRYAPLLKLAAVSLFYFLDVLFFFHAFRYLASGIVGTLEFLFPVMVMGIMIIFFKEKFSWSCAMAIALAMAGVFFLSWGSMTGNPQAGTRVLPGVLFSLLAALFNALYFVGLRMARLSALSDTIITFYVLFFGAIYCLVNAIFSSSPLLIGGPRQIGLAAALALVTAVISNLALVMAIQRIGPTLTSILGVMEPLTAVAIGITVFGEPVTPCILLGVALAVFSVLAGVWWRRHAKN